MTEPAAPATENPLDYAQLLVGDPVLFGRGPLRHTYWSAQEHILRAITHERRVAVKACNGSGKTFVAADAAIWWLTRHRHGIVVTTAPNDIQLRKVLWGHIHRNLGRFRLVTWQVNQKEVRISPTNYMIGMTTDEPERFSGWHGQVLVIMDEAPGIKPFIWDAIDGLQAAGDVHVLALGNPTIPGGPFYNAFSRNAAAWHTITIDAFDTPNLRGLSVDDLERMDDAELDANPVPQITSRRWVRDMARAHGLTSPVWQARVRGQFPSQSSDALYPLAWLERAQQAAPDPGGPVVAGIDVAGPGEDETALVIRAGDVVLVQRAWTQSDARGPVLAALAPWRQRLSAVHVDVTGIGHYFAAQLESEGYPVSGITVGLPSVDPGRWVNYKAELYWMLRERLQDGALRNWQDREAFGQAASIRYKQDGRGRIVIESKDEMRKRGMPSPDRLEALILAFIRPANRGSMRMAATGARALSLS